MTFANFSDPERDAMRLAIDLAKKCQSESREDPPPKVGAVLVKDGKAVAEAYRGQDHPGEHAEHVLLERLVPDMDVAGATLFTTLEPCSRRGPNKKPCAMRVVERGIAEVVIGIYDPNPKIYREGWRILRDAGVRLRDFPSDLREEIRVDNLDFRNRFQIAEGLEGTAAFDYTLNGGTFHLLYGDCSVVTRWTHRGHGSIYAIDNTFHVALARFARDFREIDDPSALDFSNHTQPVKVGETAVFRNKTGDYALVRIEDVLSRERGDDRTEVRLKYELRPHA